MQFIFGLVIGVILGFAFRGIEARKLAQANAFLHSEIIKLKTRL